MGETRYVGMMFSPESIQGMVAGNKMQTRRPVKQAMIDRCCYVHETGNSQGSYRDSHGAWVVAMGSFTYNIPAPVAKGDIIYVQEPWYRWEEDFIDENNGEVVSVEISQLWHPENLDFRRLPAYSMPKKFARHFLEVLDVRVERLHSISPADAISEGVRFIDRDGTRIYYDYLEGPYVWPNRPIESYASMWDHVNSGKNRPKWADNPLVFAITFRYLEDHKPPFQ